MGHGAQRWIKIKRKTKAITDVANVAPKPKPTEELKKQIHELESIINDGFQNSSSRNFSKLCIHRVPTYLRRVDKNAYHPKIVSIGPLHHPDKSLQPMEEHKVRFLKRLFEQSGQQNRLTESIVEQTEPIPQDRTSHNIQERIIESMIEMEEEARNCYSETFQDMDSNKFVMMMILDGIFVIELLRIYTKCHDNQENVDEPIFTTRWMLSTLQRDLLLLENQLPFFVLQKLFELTSTRDEKTSLVDLALKFFDPLMPGEKKCTDTAKDKHEHLLGLFRRSFLVPDNIEKIANCLQVPQRQQSKTAITPETEERVQQHQSPNAEHVVQFQERQLIHCVKELQDAGIKFKKRKGCNLLDIKFKNGFLEIPPLLIEDFTGSIILNFVAYEQCDRFLTPFFTHYVLFFDSLVNSSKDVELLHYDQIIYHTLGSDEEVANLFNKLCKEVVYDVDGCYLGNEIKEINKYCESRWSAWRAELVHDYFSNPWACLSLFAAILLLTLTIGQTFFSFFSYFRPSS